MLHLGTAMETTGTARFIETEKQFLMNKNQWLEGSMLHKKPV
jgi:hypothetical protein